MTAPRDDDVPDPGDENRPAGAELCPRCGVKRVGAFRSCLSCGFDYEAPKDPIFVPPPENHSAPPPRPASFVALPPAPAPSVTRPARITRRAVPAIGSRRTRLAAVVSAVLLIAVAAIVTIGLGRPRPAGEASTSTPPSHAATFTAIPRQAITEACVEQISPFVKSLESLDSGVGANVSFQDYSKLFAASQAVRGSVDISKLDRPCIAIFAAGQAVLGAHAQAYNTWNDCNTTTGCTRQSIEGSLKESWANAKATLASVQASMP